MYAIHTSTLNIKVAKIAQTAHNYPPMRSPTFTGIFEGPGDSNLFQTSDFVWTSPGAFFFAAAPDQCQGNGYFHVR